MKQDLVIIDRTAMLDALEGVTHFDTCAWVRANDERCKTGGPPVARCCDCGLDRVYELLADASAA